MLLEERPPKDGTHGEKIVLVKFKREIEKDTGIRLLYGTALIKNNAQTGGKEDTNEKNDV